MIQAGNELLRHASSITPNPRRVLSKTRARRRRHAVRLRLIFILTLAAIISVIASGLGCSSEKPVEPTVSVQVVPVKKATIEQAVTSEAVLYPHAQSAKVTLEAQQKLYDSREDLYKQGALPRKDLDQAAVALTQAKNQYELAQRHLDALMAVSKQQELKSAAGQLQSAKGKYLGAQ